MMFRGNGELGLFFSDGQRVGLWWAVTVTRRGDVYAWGPPDAMGREMFRLSHHPDGNRHYRVAGGPATAIERTIPLDTVAWLGGWTHHAVDWSSTPRPDTPTRRSLVINDLEHLLQGVDWTVALWVLPPGQERRIMAETFTEPTRESHVIYHVDWTFPQFVVEAQRMPFPATPGAAAPPVRTLALPSPSASSEGEIGQIVMYLEGPVPPVSAQDPDDSAKSPQSREARSDAQPT
jgi:hypothetical protein